MSDKLPIPVMKPFAFRVKGYRSDGMDRHGVWEIIGCDGMGGENEKLIEAVISWFQSMTQGNFQMVGSYDGAISEACKDLCQKQYRFMENLIEWIGTKEQTS